MIPRKIESKLLAFAKAFPVVAVVGPRQSGKTTLVKDAFPTMPYVSLEALDTRAFAQQDPRGFLSNYPQGVILDEIQRVPELFSYIQGVVDQRNQPGFFVLTGSQHFLLMEKISQTLAGRIGILELLPFSYDEIPLEKRPSSLEEAIFQGGYPRLYDQPVAAHDWFPAYIQTYVERDVRQLKNVTDLDSFQRFLKLCAGRTGQILNYSSLATDAGITHHTAKAWISLLETSFIIYQLRPHHRNFNKRLIKMPKLYFLDTGLACSLLGLEQAGALTTHHMRGALFETWVVVELLKERWNRGLRSNLHYWRDKTGHEVDVLLEAEDRLIPIEIKSTKTLTSDAFKGLAYWTKLSKTISDTAYLVYGGDQPQSRQETTVVSWKNIAQFENPPRRNSSP